GNSVSQAFTVAVVQTGTNQPPSITSSPSFVAAVGQPYQYQVMATDPEHQTLTYSLVSAYPQSLTFDGTTGLLQWTPAAGDVGPLPISVVVTDSAGAYSSQNYTLRVSLNHRPTITSNPTLSIAAGATYRYDVRASDPDNDPLTYSLDQGPVGMTID